MGRVRREVARGSDVVVVALGSAVDAEQPVMAVATTAKNASDALAARCMGRFSGKGAVSRRWCGEESKGEATCTTRDPSRRGAARPGDRDRAGGHFLGQS